MVTPFYFLNTGLFAVFNRFNGDTRTVFIVRTMSGLYDYVLPVARESFEKLKLSHSHSIEKIALPAHFLDNVRVCGSHLPCHKVGEREDQERAF